jgi:phosphoribosylglycinamide formyltransferase 1
MPNEAPRADANADANADTSAVPVPVAVLISGRGSNLKALIAGQSDWPYRIAAVVSSAADAPGLGLAQASGIPTQVLAPKGFADRIDYDRALAALLDRCAPDLVALAGFMRILGPELVGRYPGRMLNIHPSLLPRHPGLHTHQRVLEAGETETGATVHFVTAELDGGPRIAQTLVPVLPGDNAERLAARVLAREHRIYPLVLGWLAAGRLHMGEDGRPVLDGVALDAPLSLDDRYLGMA